MNLKKLQSQGPLGILTFWVLLFLFAISLAAGIFAIYWTSITASSFWLSAVNSSLLIVNIFLAVFSFASITFLLLTSFEVVVGYPGFSSQLHAVSSFLSHLFCFILMFLSTQNKADDYYLSLADFCIRNPEDPLVVTFLSDHQTEYSIRAYVYARSIDLSGSIAAFFGLWVPMTVGFLLCAHWLGSSQNENPARPTELVEREFETSTMLTINPPKN
jgi:hypothetical protein